MHESNSSFEALIGRVSQGSETAVWELLERYSSQIVRTVRRRLPNELRSIVDSTDIVQSAWVSLLRTGSRLDPITTAEQFIAYLAGIARFKILETHRKHTVTKATNIRRQVRIDDELANPDHEYAPGGYEHPLRDRRNTSPSSIASTREVWKQTIEEFGDRGEGILQLRLQGLTNAAIAECLGISTKTVQRTLNSMLQSLTK